MTDPLPSENPHSATRKALFAIFSIFLACFVIVLRAVLWPIIVVRAAIRAYTTRTWGQTWRVLSVEGQEDRWTLKVESAEQFPKRWPAPQPPISLELNNIVRARWIADYDHHRGFDNTTLIWHLAFALTDGTQISLLESGTDESYEPQELAKIIPALRSRNLVKRPRNLTANSRLTIFDIVAGVLWLMLVAYMFGAPI